MQDFGIQILQIPPFDDAIREHWEVSAHDVDLFGFSALCEPAMQYPWSLCINVAEFVTEEPFASEFRQGIANAISTVAGVQSMEEAAADVWVVSGEPDGEALVHAVLLYLVEMSPQLQAVLSQQRSTH